MKININYSLSAGRVAEEKYLERNKLKLKLQGTEKAIEITKKKISNQENKINIKKKEKPIFKKKIDKKKEWYHSFRWFFTSSGFLVLAGRDTKNNEQLVKRYFTDKDLYFHAEVSGAPHVILKNDKNIDVSLKDKEEAACFALIFSSAWKNKYYSAEVYSVLKDQVSKTANTGESLGTGAFVIRGKREYYKKLNLKLKIIFDKEKGLYSFPVLLTENVGKSDIIVVPGNLKKSDVSKKIKDVFLKRKILLTTEEIDGVLPPGPCSLLD